MRFASPLLLLLLPLLWIGLFWVRPRLVRSGRLKYSSLSVLRGLAGSRFPRRSVLMGLRALALSLFVLALARPQSGKRYTEVRSEGVDILLALDTSGSMQALDMKLDGQAVPRVEVVKRVATDFIAKRPNDRLGVVVFGDTAFLQCPLTLDHGILVSLMDQVRVGVAGDATAIGDAIGVAVNHMKGLKAKSKVVVLLTDGESNSGIIPPLKAAEIAKAFGVKIYTIGIGTEGEAPFLVDTPFGKQVVYQRADLDEESLKRIAQETGAKFFRAKDTDALQKVYSEIDRLEKSEVKTKEFSRYDELYGRFAASGLFLLLLEVILGQTVLGKVP